MSFKKAFLRGLLGIPIGIFISTTITILISIGWGYGQYLAVAPELTKQMGTELNAIVVQYVLSGVLGFAFAIGSVIWEVEKWSILKQTLLHFVLTSVAMFPIAYLCHWIDHTFLSALIYFAVFAAIYFIIWLLQYNFWKKKINAMNSKIQDKLI